MLAGRPAFSGDSVVAVIMNVVTGTPAPLASLAPGVTPEVIAAIDRALAKKPEARFADVGAFIEALTGKPLQTLGGASAAAAPGAAAAPLSQEELMAATMAPASAAAAGPAAPAPAGAPTGAASTGGAPTGAAPIAVTKARRLPQPKSPLPFVVAFVVLGGIAFLVAPRGAKPPPAKPWVSSVLDKAPAAAAPPPPPAAPTKPASDDVPPPAAPAAKEPVAAMQPAKEPVAKETRGARAAHAPSPLPDDVRADLEAAESALGRGDTREGKRLAQHSLLGRRTDRAFSVLTRAACREGDLANARAGLRNVSGAERGAVLKACAAAGLDLR
jgi:serine/threonine-protein kinase